MRALFATHAKEKVYDDSAREKTRYELSRGVIVSSYRRLRRFSVHRFQVALDLMPSDGERLLDVGCSDGGFIFMAKDKFKECYGVDVSPVRIRLAKNKAKERSDADDFYFYKCDVDEGLAFRDSFFSAVSCIAVLEHVFYPPYVVKEIRRVLKPSGVFIVGVPNVAWIPNRLKLLSGKLPLTGNPYLGTDWDHLHNYTKASLFRLLTGSGFEIKNVSCSSIFARLRKLWSSALSGDLIVKCIKT